jgi:hypothetical protein
MHKLSLICTLVTVLIYPFQSAEAQTPTEGMAAIAGSIGVMVPDEQLENTITIEGQGEYYLTPRVSFRSLLNWSSPGFAGRTEDNFRQFRWLFGAVYNWEQGVFHPFVTGGAGAYFVRQQLDDREDPDGETRGGIHLGGGVEYFTSGRTTIKGEARWDIVSHPPGLPDASGFTLMIGLKRYF